MRLSSCSACGLLLLLLNLQLICSYPVSLTNTDVDLLKVLLDRLQESVPEQNDVDQGDPLDRFHEEDIVDTAEPSQKDLEEAAIREFLSAKNLKSVRNNNSNSRSSSGCFGRRMDRIGSMSSLGCNTVGRSNPK